ncbi:hypothetical protein BD310DRAFT_983062 [Dichomitus squalens]|uniref:Uncharacterized protein n=1 Tax=Dichomitus squalens TaxID=114155 RepID=A0A4Q9PAJ6_9APHY|nr:hypothetical protein BD310DRAFT_983062 [Dichomitus squalens]
MATLESLEPRLYLLTETRSKHFGSAEDVRAVTLFVNGVSATFNVLLPTAEILLAITPETEILQWIELAEGDTLRACDISDAQRDIVLKILYAYRACYFQHGVTPADIELFFRLVAEAAMALDDHEPADEVLEDLVQYVTSAFPSDCLATLPTTLHPPHPPVTCTSPPPVTCVSLPSDASSVAAPLGRPAPAPTVAGMRVRPPRPLPKRSHTVPPVSPVHHSPTTLPSLASVLSPSAVAAERTFGDCTPAHVSVSQDDDSWPSDDSVPDLESIAGSESDSEDPYNFRQHLSFEELVNLDMQDFLSRLSRQ